LLLADIRARHAWDKFSLVAKSIVVAEKLLGYGLDVVEDMNISKFNNSPIKSRQVAGSEEKGKVQLPLRSSWKTDYEGFTKGNAWPRKPGQFTTKPPRLWRRSRT